MKRLFDFVCALIGLLFLAPVLLFIAVAIIIDSRGGVFFRQVRVGYKNQDFYLMKFRTMRTGSDKKGLLTVGKRDSRVTKLGYYLRRYKIDELPQLINVLVGDMSLVGPRPEVRKYVDMYSAEQLQVLDVKPGITDVASLEFINENELLGKSKNPEKTYIESIMPMKLEMNLRYIERRDFFSDIRIIIKTIKRIVS